MGHTERSAQSGMYSSWSTLPGVPRVNRLMSEGLLIQDDVGLLLAIVVLALGKPFTHICYSGKSPASESPIYQGDVLVT